ncbi:MAG: cob(I)yrinic acid a,c-diamide adenosyltransferase [Alloprevotella sp.]
MPRNTVYTRQGDQGRTRLADGQLVSKTHPRVTCLGVLDELNSHIGLLRAFLQRDFPAVAADDSELLLAVQRSLFDAGSLAAGCDCGADFTVGTRQLEVAIDCAPMPAFDGFVLPGGHLAAAQAHVARTVCRRAERALLSAGAAEWASHTALLAYINRLSDYLFVLARKINALAGADEIKR